MAAAAPSLDQLMEDLRRIARDAPLPASEAPEAAAPPLNSLTLADHGIRVQGFPAVAAPVPVKEKKANGKKNMLLLGGALSLVVLVIGAVLVFGRKREAGQAGTDLSGGRRAEGETGRQRNGLAAEPKAAAQSGQSGRGGGGEEGEEREEADGRESEHERRVRFARQVHVREFEREQPPQVSVKISSDDVL
jgi:hypothetical protein